MHLFLIISKITQLIIKPYQVIDNMTAWSVASTIAKPLFANIAHNHTVWFVNATIFAGKVRQFFTVIKLFILFFKLKFT